MNVLLSHGYFIAEDVKEQKIMRPYPPLGILYLSAYLKERNVDVKVFDSTFSTLDEQQQFILTHRPRFIGLYVNLMTKVNILKTVEFVRAQPELKGTKIILGGPEVRNHKENFLRSGADVLVLGEGEETMFDVISTLGNAFSPFLDQVPGIAFLNAKDRLVETQERTKIRDINTLPIPDRSSIDLQPYLDTWKNFHGHSTTSISTMRGCPYTCKWCSRAVYGLSYRRRQPKLVVDEFEQVINTYGVESFWVVDDVFTVSHKWLREFRDEVVARGIQLRYECITRADRMNDEVIALLKETGCFRVWIGAESGSQKIIDAMDRRVKVETVREMIQATRAEGLEAGTFIMLGYPGETEEDIEETIHHLVVSDPDLYTITVAYPIKGTALYEEVEADFTTDLPWESSTDRDIDFKRTYPRRYYDYAVRRVYNEVNFHKQLARKSYIRATRHKLWSVAAKAGMWWHRRKAQSA